MTAVGTAAPADEALLEALRDALGNDVVLLGRRPYAYATSSQLEELEITLGDGDTRTLIFKDLAWGRQLEDARDAKPRFLFEPRRDIDTYRHILARVGIGPRCYVAIADSRRGRFWLMLEKVPGVELWQVGDMDVWETVSRWLAEFHARFAERAAAVRGANSRLLVYGGEWYRLWWRRAQTALARTEDPRAPELIDALSRYEDVVDALDALPTTFVHGEFYPSNVLVDSNGGNPRVWPVDWEMAGTGPGMLDLAALSGGWGTAERERLVAAYRAAAQPACGPGRLGPEPARDVDRCRLHLALQWIGWSAGWQAPREHASDWIGEALLLARSLAL